MSAGPNEVSVSVVGRPPVKAGDSITINEASYKVLMIQPAKSYTDEYGYTVYWPCAEIIALLEEKP